MRRLLYIKDYADEIRLHEEFLPLPIESQNKEELLNALLLELNEESRLNLSYVDKRKLLHAKINTLAPNTLQEEAICKLDQLLQLDLADKTIVDVRALMEKSKLQFGNTKIVLWQGDISTLKTDAIVNAANNQMLGCWQPLHACIDNVIHTAAGVQLRDDCNRIMKKQGFAEPTATAKVTRAYNLPSKFVLHTVGPIVQGTVSEQNKADLAKAYTSCLEVGKQMEAIQSIAFCGISTGVFGYPATEAAEVAFSTVKHWLIENSQSLELVVFNVFSDRDRLIYENLLESLD